MGEVSKQVRVDNWGIFFLSRLQVFFNKTDYCDLTLQFEGNVQLKVHRLVMNACTEYFQFLEQTCEVVDDVLLMPPDLQADVILPIVNFMYTGMLEFQTSIFDRLYKTAQLMNITVLLKLLDAQSQKLKVTPKTAKVSPQQQQSVKKYKDVKPVVKKQSGWKKKALSYSKMAPSSKHATEIRSRSSADVLKFDNAPRPTRFEWPDEDEMVKPFDNMLDTAFDNISYTSEPLLTQDEEIKRESSTFDDLRYLPSNNQTSKKVPITRNSPGKESSLDIEELKKYAREHKIRSDYVDYDNDDPDDPDYVPTGSYKRKLPITPHSKRPRVVSSEKDSARDSKETKINITASGKGPIDHSKLITEVLRKYPHLKKNKNIRLKIITNNNKSTDGVDISIDEQKQDNKGVSKMKTIAKPKELEVKKQAKICTAENSWICSKCSTEGSPLEFVLYYLYRKHMTDMHHMKFDAGSCKHCGDVFEEQAILVYHMYVMHGVSPPRDINFPKCTLCSFVMLDDKLMEKHMQFHDNATHVQCASCKLGFIDRTALKTHKQISGHNTDRSSSNVSNVSQFDCSYCTRNMNSSGALFIHLKTHHLSEAKSDGVLSLDHEVERSVKILSDVKLDAGPECSTQRSVSQVTNVTNVTNVASGIATSLGLVDIVVLDENEQSAFIVPSSTETQTQQQTDTNSTDDSDNYIMPQLPNQLIGNDIGSTDELVMVLTDHDYNDGNSDVLSTDNSNIVVLYSHPVEGQSENQFINQGNIMLNSETGMLELRNHSTTTSGEHHSEAPQESIELIQKEIQSTQKSTSEETQIEGQQIEGQQIEGQQIEGQQIEGQQIEEQDAENEKSALDDKHSAGTEIKEIEETEETETEETETEKPTKDVVDGDGEVKTDNEEPMEVDPMNEETIDRIEPDFTEKPTEIEDREEKIDEKKKEDLENTKTNETIVDESSTDDKKQQNQKDSVPEMNDSSDNTVKPLVGEESKEIIDETITDETIIDETSLEKPLLDEPMEVDSSKTDRETCNNESTEEKEINPIEEDDDDEEDNTEKMEEILSEDPKESAVSEENNLPKKGDGKEGKESCISILHDWEDTDSQQSEEKATSVNKLINDWDDD